MNWLAPFSQVASSVQVPVCSHRHCRRSDWQRWKSRRDGILFNWRWYCGRDCLVEAVSEFLGQLRSGSSQRTSVHRLPLGLLMLSRGTIDQEHLHSALRRKDEDPSLRIGECLRAIGAVSEVQITRALGAQNCLPVLLTRNVKVGGSVPIHLQKLNDAVCFYAPRTTDIMYVGFGVCASAQFVKAIEFMNGIPVEPCMTPLSFIRECLEHSPGRWRQSEVVFNQKCSPEEITSTIVSYALQVGCERLTAVDTGGWLWTRLDGGEGMHLNFRLRDPKES